MGLGFSHPTIRDCLLITLPRIMYPLPRQPVQGRLRARTGALRCLLTFANSRVQAGGTEGRSLAGQETGAGETGVGDLRNEGRRGSGWAPGADEWDLMGLGRAVTKGGAESWETMGERGWVLQGLREPSPHAYIGALQRFQRLPVPGGVSSPEDKRVSITACAPVVIFPPRRAKHPDPSHLL